MIQINNFEIANDGNELHLNISTTPSNIITSLYLWNIDTFKNYELAYDLSYLLQQDDENEELIITTDQLNISKFEDIWFAEIRDNTVVTNECGCDDKTLGIVYNMLPYYKCLYENFSKYINNQCEKINDLILTIDIYIETIIKSLDLGLYIESIDILKKLKQLCNINNCTNCSQIECKKCSNFKQF